MPVDTRTVTGRRTLRFQTLGDLRAEITRLSAAERAGTLRHVGNWSLGQCYHHLASWMTYIFDGVPGPKPPFFVRWMGPFLKKRFLGGGMPVGFRMPKVKEGTYATEPMDLVPAEAMYRAAIERLERGTPPDRHMIFGAMTKDEWIAMHLRHAELHLSFQVPS